MQLIQINGCSCSGKSTTVRGVLEKKGGLYHLSYDLQKWRFSDYTREKYHDDIRAIILAIADTVFSQKHPVLCDNSLYRDHREKIASKARAHGYKVIEINLEAPYSVAEARFHERVEDARGNPNAKIANTSLERFKELYETYNAEKNPNAIVYRSDVMTPEEIISNVLTLIK